jgi:hypothetical protein
MFAKDSKWQDSQHQPLIEEDGNARIDHELFQHDDEGSILRYLGSFLAIRSIDKFVLQCFSPTIIFD